MAVNWAGLIGICACVAGIFIGKFQKGLYLPLPHPANVPVQYMDPDNVPKFGELEGVYAPNEKLRGATKLFEGKIQGSESVAVAKDSSLYMLDKFGFVWRAPRNAAGSYDLEKEPLAHLGSGRPLGFHFDAEGNLIVCMAGAGLVMLEKDSGKVVLLTARVSSDDPVAPGSAIDYINDVAVASNGIVYFTDSVEGIMPVKNAYGFWDTMAAYTLSLFNGRASGRLLSYNPATRKTHVVAEDIWFANGVTLSKDESFAAVVETNVQRVHRVWLSGPKAGQREVLVDQLPGFPDGITTSSSGSFWVGLVVPQQPIVAWLENRYVRWLAAWLPAQIKPPILQWGGVVEISAEGQPLQALYDSEGLHVRSISAVTESDNRLFFGNLAEDYVSYIEKPKAGQ
ncbi:Adipocyte plasma membrane-associated protein [Coccomyxa sp. Obi]|nr:Adipocyte plasma membrane-associated protein [Coccomyxa sp. Obi]